MNHTCAENLTSATHPKMESKKRGHTPNVIVTWSKMRVLMGRPGRRQTANAPKLGTTGMFLLLKTFRILAATDLFRS